MQNTAQVVIIWLMSSIKHTIISSAGDVVRVRRVRRRDAVGKLAQGIDEQLMAGVDEVQRHGRAHDTEANKTDLEGGKRHGYFSVEIEIVSVRGLRRPSNAGASPVRFQWWWQACIRNRSSRCNQCGPSARTGIDS